MSGIEKRIEEVQRKHREELHEEGVCICGWHAHREFDYPGHVAAAVVEALGLSPEQRTLADGAGGISTNYLTGETTAYSKPCTRQSRWVTAWETL